MLTKRIIPCLDVDKGRVVKGVKFKGIVDAGNPVQLAARYYETGADELVFLDITASLEARKTTIEVVSKVAKEIFIPLTVGGGVKTVKDVKSLLAAGADKVAMNTSAVKNPNLITEAAKKFGSQCVVLAVDAKKNGESWEVYINGGRTPTGKDAIVWMNEVQKLGAGEILLTSMDADGTRAGYDLKLLKEVSKLNIPVIASGGAGSIKDLMSALDAGADAVLAASIFHYDKISPLELKKELSKNGYVVRL